MPQLAQDRMIVYMAGSSRVPSAEVADRLREHGASVVDEQPTMLLVGGPPSAIRAVVASLPGWELSELVTYPKPPVKHKVRNSQ